MMNKNRRHLYIYKETLLFEKTGNCDACIDRKKVTEDRG